MAVGIIKHGCSGTNKLRHGDKTPEYSAWLGMRKRCNNPNSKSFPNYGGRGIKVCDRWDDFANFLADMGEKPSRQHSLDRVDPDKGYSPDNTRWATLKEQANNKRRSIRVTFQGKEMTLQDVADLTGIKWSTLWARHDKGYPIDKDPKVRTLFKSVCVVCGSEFEATRKVAKCCSKRCAQIDIRRRKRIS